MLSRLFRNTSVLSLILCFTISCEWDVKCINGLGQVPNDVQIESYIIGHLYQLDSVIATVIDTDSSQVASLVQENSEILNGTSRGLKKEDFEINTGGGKKVNQYFLGMTMDSIVYPTNDSKQFIKDDGHPIYKVESVVIFWKVKLVDKKGNILLDSHFPMSCAISSACLMKERMQKL